MGESVPTYLPREVPSHYYSGILPAYLPRDWFEPSEQVVPLVDDQYHRDYHTWKNCLDANTRATKIFSWPLDGSFVPSHRSSIEYSQINFLPYCQSCRTQVVERISQHISQFQQPHTI
jgi:hypothetical protein